MRAVRAENDRPEARSRGARRRSARSPRRPRGLYAAPTEAVWFLRDNARPRALEPRRGASHVRYCQNLRPEDARNPRRRARCRRRHGRALCFFRRSPRHVDGGRRRALWPNACSGRAQKVAACRSTPTMPRCDAIVSGLRPDWLQLHGHETPERVARGQGSVSACR